MPRMNMSFSLSSHLHSNVALVSGNTSDEHVDATEDIKLQLISVMRLFKIIFCHIVSDRRAKEKMLLKAEKDLETMSTR